CWLIVDDGSQDNTRELVQSWISAGLIEITYIYQENRGMLGAHNTAYDNITTELNICIDSDDYLTDEAIENILTLWRENREPSLAGIVGLDASPTGEVIGSRLPEGVKFSNYTELFERYKITGDKKFIFRTDIINEFPRYPVFPGEKFPA